MPVHTLEYGSISYSILFEPEPLPPDRQANRHGDRVGHTLPVRRGVFAGEVRLADSCAFTRYHLLMARTRDISAPRATSVGEVEAEAEADSKSVLTRRRILDAAAHVLSVKGYGGLRLTDVAAEADLQAPAIYYYFPSREDLIEEVMWAGIADMNVHVAKILGALPTKASALDRLLAAVEAHLRHALETSDYTTAAIRNAGQVPHAIRQRQILEEERYGEIWRKLVNDLARSGTLRADLDLYIAQMLVLGALNWTVEWWDSRRGSVDAVVANAQTLVRHGLTEVRPTRRK
jgi:TetR/AcrR family transcriptional regulator, cholesterol catabolism regulator